jgi:hypothetical protein
MPIALDQAGERGSSITLEPGVRVELVASPRTLPTSRANEITNGMIDLTWRACRGGDEGKWDLIRDGWQEYYDAGGSRAEDYDRLVLVYANERMVQFSGMMVKRMRPDVTLLWYHVACTDPAFQGAGAFGAALRLIVDPDWCRSFPEPTYIVFRTPNPVIYVTGYRYVASISDEWDYQPKITPGAKIEPLPRAVHELARRMSATIAPGSEYDADTFVVRDFLGRHGAIYRTPAPPAKDATVNEYFETHLRRQPQDALFNFVRVR